MIPIHGGFGSPSVQFLFRSAAILPTSFSRRAPLCSSAIHTIRAYLLACKPRPSPESNACPRNLPFALRRVDGNLRIPDSPLSLRPFVAIRTLGYRETFFAYSAAVSDTPVRSVPRLGARKRRAVAGFATASGASINIPAGSISINVPAAGN